MKAGSFLLVAIPLARCEVAAAFHLSPHRHPTPSRSSGPRTQLLSIVDADNGGGGVSPPLRSWFLEESGDRVSVRVQSRGEFVRTAGISSAAVVGSTLFPFTPRSSPAFDGGVGGLGKTKPETGVVFVNTDGMSADPGPDGYVTNELLSPDGTTPAIVMFRAPWPMQRSGVSVESRDLANPEAAFVQVALTPFSGKGKVAGDLAKDFFEETVFGKRGKFGAYGSPSDIKVKKLGPTAETALGTTVYIASFTTLTPAMRESERQVFISCCILGDGVFMLVTGTTAPRFRKLEKELRRVADSFSVVAAPKTGLRSSL